MSKPPNRPSHLKLVSSQPGKQKQPKRPRPSGALYKRVLVLFAGLFVGTLVVIALYEGAQPDLRDAIVALVFGLLIAGIELFRGRRATS
jgi:hypothetical protein